MPISKRRAALVRRIGRVHRLERDVAVLSAPMPGSGLVALYPAVIARALRKAKRDLHEARVKVPR